MILYYCITVLPIDPLNVNFRNFIDNFTDIDDGLYVEDEELLSFVFYFIPFLYSTVKFGQSCCCSNGDSILEQHWPDTNRKGARP